MKNKKTKALARRGTKGSQRSSRTASTRRVLSALPTSKAKNAYALLSEVKALILAEPLRYDQREWLSRQKECPNLGIKYPACGTVGCVAGWVATLKGPKRFQWDKAGEVADRVLGLSDEQSRALFSEGAVSYDTWPQSVEHAKAGAAHIAAFQKQHRAQLLAKAV